MYAICFKNQQARFFCETYIVGVVLHLAQACGDSGEKTFQLIQLIHLNSSCINLFLKIKPNIHTDKAIKGLTVTCSFGPTVLPLSVLDYTAE